MKQSTDAKSFEVEPAWELVIDFTKIQSSGVSAVDILEIIESMK